MWKRRTILVGLLSVFMVLTPTLKANTQGNSEENTEIPQILQLNPSSSFDKEAIEEWVEKYSWQNAYHLVNVSHSRSVLKGIEHQGGTRIVLETESLGSMSEEEKTQTIERIINIMDKRVNRYGITQATLKSLDDNKIEVKVPASVDPEVARRLIGRTGLLEFKKVIESGAPGSSLSPSNLSQEVVYGRKQECGEWRPYLVQKKPLMTGKFIKNAAVKKSQRAQNPIFVALQFKNEGAKKFADVIPSLEPNKDRIAIVVDNVVQSAPVISQGIWDMADNTNSIERATIEGDFTKDEARRLVVVLQAGAFPIDVIMLRQETIKKEEEGAAFGEETIRANVVLYTPMFTWMEENYKGELRFWSQEKIEEEYEEKSLSPDEGAHFKVQIKTKDKSELLKENLRFVLEDKKENRWESQRVEFSEIKKKQMKDVPTYERNVDVWFSFSEDRKPNWSELTLYIIRTDIIGRDEVTWTF